MKLLNSLILVLNSTMLLIPLKAGAGQELDKSSRFHTIPTWSYDITSTRDGGQYHGVIVGQQPGKQAGATSVPVFIVPLIIKTHSLGVSLNPASGVIGTQPGDTTFDPTAPNGCYPPPNNVPVDLIAQSPLFQPAAFNFGGTFVGYTQYVDAFQRANFWQILGDDRDRYHVLFSPVKVLDPVTVDVPAVYGLALTNASISINPPLCDPFGLVDGNWFLSYLQSNILPSLAAKGVNPENLPVFISTIDSWHDSVTNLKSGGFGAIHSVTGYPLPLQAFVLTTARDTLPLSHELAEWMNDPWVTNPTPYWGHVGAITGCQSNLEVGDPLSFRSYLVPMPNNYTYTVQELAFDSWFFGGPSTGVNGWYSNNGTFLSDAGPLCHQ